MAAEKVHEKRAVSSGESSDSSFGGRRRLMKKMRKDSARDRKEEAYEAQARLKLQTLHLQSGTSEDQKQDAATAAAAAGLALLPDIPEEAKTTAETNRELGMPLPSLPEASTAEELSRGRPGEVLESVVEGVAFRDVATSAAFRNAAAAAATAGVPLAPLQETTAGFVREHEPTNVGSQSGSLGDSPPLGNSEGC